MVAQYLPYCLLFFLGLAAVNRWRSMVRLALVIISGIAIPATAVRDTGTTAHVFVVENGRLTKRPVSLGARDESRGLVAITAGLRDGERILTSPAPGTAEGLAVTVVADTSGGAQATSAESAAESPRAAAPRPGGR